MDKEEGEMSDDAMQVDSETEENIVIYKAEKNGLVVKHLEKVDASKLEERAKRFGLDLSSKRLVTQKQIDELYEHLGVESENERHFQFDTLHLKGVSDLDTNDIFEYLEDFKPVSLEWVDETSCNVVCPDHITAALALLVHSREIKNEDLKHMLTIKSEYHWREGMPHPKKDLILMRFATNADKKISVKKSHKPHYQDDEWSENTVSKNPWGDLCKSWGVYDHQEFFNRKPLTGDQVHLAFRGKSKDLAMRLGKRQQIDVENDESDSDTEWTKKSKAPRMRMHADDEETKHKKTYSLAEPSRDDSDSDTYAPLSIEIDNSRTSYTPRETSKLSDKFKSFDKLKEQKSSIMWRLGKKVSNNDNINQALNSDDELNHNIMSRVQKVTQVNSSDVWSRLETKPSASDLRQVIRSKNKKQSKADDLRDLIGKQKR